MAAEKQTLGAFKESVLEVVAAERPELSKADVNAVLDALVTQAQSDLADGWEVPLLGLVKLTPTLKVGRKKGTEVRNPFNNTTSTIKKDEPDSVKIKAKPMAAAKKALPSGSALKNLVSALR